MNGYVSLSIQPYVGLRISLPVFPLPSEIPEGIVATMDEIRNSLMTGCPFPGSVVVSELTIFAETGNWDVSCEPLELVDGAGLCDVALDMVMHYGFEFGPLPPPEW